MPILNFPTNPNVNQQYSFGGKTWYWTGEAWRLLNTGAINDIPIGNITPSTGNFTALNASNVSVIGNISGNYFYGNGRYLTGVSGSGGPTTKIQSGTTLVNIPIPSSNVVITVSGTANVAVFSDTDVVLAANLLPESANLTIGSAASPFHDGYFTGNLTANNFVGNITGNIFIGAGNTEVVYTDQGMATGSPAFTFNQASNVLTVTGNISATGNIQAHYLLGNASALTGAMVDRGSDTNNWDLLTQMGVYTVNRNSWAGTTGTPLDSQVFVGLLEVKNSTDTALEQIFFPGTVSNGNVKIQWNRANWSGSWTAWIKIINDDQVFTGGTF